jgi:hypothetical protein
MAPFQAHGDGTGGEIEVSEPKPAQGVLAESEPGQALMPTCSRRGWAAISFSTSSWARARRSTRFSFGPRMFVVGFARSSPSPTSQVRNALTIANRCRRVAAALCRQWWSRNALTTWVPAGGSSNWARAVDGRASEEGNYPPTSLVEA